LNALSNEQLKVVVIFTVVSIISVLCLCRLLCTMSFLSLTANGLGLGEGGELEVQMFKLALQPHFCQTLVTCMLCF
jgi:hypothetical protein